METKQNNEIINTLENKKFISQSQLNKIEKWLKTEFNENFDHNLIEDHL